MANRLSKLEGVIGMPVQVPRFGDGKPIPAIRPVGKWIIRRNGKSRTNATAKIRAIGQVA
jgi:hypothetical protein